MSGLNGLERFFGWLIQTTAEAAVIALMILLVQVLLKNRLSPGWRHGLWFLLLVRLVLPATPQSAVSVFNFIKWTRTRPVTSTLVTPPAVAVAIARLEPVAAGDVNIEPSQSLTARVTPPVIVEQPSPSSVRAAASPPALRTPPVRSLDWLDAAALVWLAGALTLLLRFVWSNQRFERRLASCPVLSDEGVTKVFDECRKLLGVTGQVLLVETNEVETPAVHVFRHKRLLLPGGLREGLSLEELRHVFLHELAHIKRRDPELNWALSVLQTLHWFNPVLWFAFSRMRADRELATDALALGSSRAPDRRAYGETVLKVLEGLTPRQVPPSLVGIGESKAQIKERIRAIARGSSAGHWRWAACLLAVVIAGVALTSAREDSPKPGTDLLKRYPTTLIGGDTVASQARPWRFTAEDIFKVSSFAFEVGTHLRLEAGTSDVGIGHCDDGAVWAVLIPRERGTLTSKVATGETIAHLWLRFHPAEIDQVFPPGTVTGAGSAELEDQMLAIARAKFYSSWHAGDNAMIPEPKDLTVDVDTQKGPRRFFVVDKKAKTAEYVAAFSDRGVQPAPQPVHDGREDAKRARVVSVTPAQGATQVEPAQQLRLRFDRPMDPHYLKLEWLEGGFQLDGSIRIGADQREFVIPVRLTPGQQQKLVVNRDAELERWERLGKRPERKPSNSALAKEGFLDADSTPANEFRWSFSTRFASIKTGAAKPVVARVSPASGSVTPLLTLVELTFDQPMRAPDQAFPYLQKSGPMEGPSLIPSFNYDPATYRFSFPALLRPDDDVRLTLRGFYTADGAACEPVVLHYQTASESLDTGYVKRAREALQDPKLLKLLTSMKEARAGLRSGIETIQTIHLGLARNSFNSIEAQTATFKWQGADQVYADISGPMSMRAFILGNDGLNCWLYSVDEKSEQRLDKTPAAITQREIVLIDPFGLGSGSVKDTLSGKQLVSAEDASLDGRRCYRLQKWEVSQNNFVFATLTEWWIDDETFLPRQIVQHSPYGCQIVRFEYNSLNQQLPDSEFQPPVAPGTETHRLFFANDPEPDETRFLRISDGANGRMSGRLGWHGSGGTTDSGLN